MCNGHQILFDDSKQTFYTKESELPNVSEGEVLVKIIYTSLCGSDIHTYTGKRKEPSPIILGHEIVGEIISFGTSTPNFDLNGQLLQLGDRVTWSIFATTSNDEFVQQQMPQKSKDLFKYGHVQYTEESKFNGGLATHCILREGTGIVKLPVTIDPKVATIINCAGATVMSTFRIIDAIEGKHVAIFGAGTLGLLAAAVAKSKGAATVTILDIDDARLTLSKKFGADFTVNTASAIDDVTTITNQFYKKGFDVIIDMSGSYDAMVLGLNASAIGAQNIWVGGVVPMNNIPINPEVMIRKLLTIKGMHNYNYQDLTEAVSFFDIHHATYDFNLLIEKEFSLNEVEQAFQYAVSKKPLRTLITNTHV